MTNWTTAVPRTGVGVRFGRPDTPTYSNRTRNWTPSEREPDKRVDTGKPDTPHAHELDKGALSGALSVARPLSPKVDREPRTDRPSEPSRFARWRKYLTALSDG